MIATVAALSFTGTQSARGALLSDLINGDTIVVGDLAFHGFSYLATGDMPDASLINVVAYTDELGKAGLLFQGGFLDFIGGGGSDALLGFQVTVLNEQKLIHGATLAGNPFVLGGAGMVSITETFLPDDELAQMSIYAISPGSTKATDNVSFAQGFSTLHVQKDILAFSAGVEGGVPTLSFFTQTFCVEDIPIPEPASAILLGTAMVGWGWFTRRKRPRA